LPEVSNSMFLGDLDAFTLITIALTLFLIAYMVAMSVFSRRKEVKVRKTFTLLKCQNCDYKKEREFKEGDYVGKVEGECPQCEGPLVIYAIYDKEEKLK